MCLTITKTQVIGDLKMSCADPCERDSANTVGNCPDCGNPVDSDGDTTEDVCSYSPVCCDTCGYQPCDQYC